MINTPQRESRLRRQREEAAMELQDNESSALEVAETLGDLKKSAEVKKLMVADCVETVNPVSSGSPHVRSVRVHRACGEPIEIKEKYSTETFYRSVS